MTIRFACPQCGKKFSVSPALIGQQRSCPQCGASFTVPDVGSKEPLPPPLQQSPPVFHAGTPADPHADALPLLRPMSGHPEDLIDVTAMVDIVFFMLIFFLVTSLQSLEAVINLPAPQSDSAAASSVMPTDITENPDNIVVTIDEDDTVWVEDEEIFGEQNLRSKLRAAKGADDDRTGLLVIGDPDATHGTLVMVLDAGADAGLTDLMFSVSEAGDEAL